MHRVTFLVVAVGNHAPRDFDLGLDDLETQEEDEDDALVLDFLEGLPFA